MENVNIKQCLKLFTENRDSQNRAAKKCNKLGNGCCLCKIAAKNCQIFARIL